MPSVARTVVSIAHRLSHISDCTTCQKDLDDHNDLNLLYHCSLSQTRNRCLGSLHYRTVSHMPLEATSSLIGHQMDSSPMDESSTGRYDDGFLELPSSLSLDARISNLDNDIIPLFQEARWQDPGTYAALKLALRLASGYLTYN